MIGEALWRRRFGGYVGIVGRTITLKSLGPDPVTTFVTSLCRDFLEQALSNPGFNKSENRKANCVIASVTNPCPIPGQAVSRLDANQGQSESSAHHPADGKSAWAHQPQMTCFRHATLQTGVIKMKYRNAIILAVPFAALLGGSVMANELTVNCGGPAPPDYATIQQAVNAALPYDTITVCPGLYNEDVLIQTEGLTIQSTEIGKQGPNTHVRAFSIGFAPSFGPHDVTIQGFSVGGDVEVIGCAIDNHIGIESSGDYNTIAHNSVYSCTYAGIRVNQDNRGNAVMENTVYEILGTGIIIEGGTPGDLHQVHNNVVYDTYGEGCIYAWASNSEIHNNQMADCNGNAGINAVDSDGLHIHNNAICNADIALYGASNDFVHNNVFYGGGAVTNAGDNTVQQNKDSNKSCPINLSD
jgi:Right handed beta helix region